MQYLKFLFLGVFYMKLKHLKIPVFISLVLLAVMFILQTAGKLNGIFGNSDFMCNAVCFFSILFLAVVIIVMGYCIKWPKDFSFTVKKNVNKNVSTSIFSLLTGVFLGAESITKLLNYINGYRDIMQLVLSLFGIASGIVFVMIGICYFIGKNIFKNREILVLIPVVWSIIRLFERFSVYSSVSRYPWEMLDEIVVIFVTLFLLNLARVFANVDNAGKLRGLFVFGYLSVIFIVFETVFLSKTNTTNTLDLQYFTNTVNYFLAIFIIALLENLSKALQKSENDKVKVLAEKPDDEVAE